MAISPWGMTGNISRALRPKTQPLARAPLPSLASKYTPPGALAGGPASFFSGNPFGLSASTARTTAPAIVKPQTPPATKPTSVPKSSLVPVVPGAQQQPQQIDEVNPNYDYNTDPILQHINAITTMNRANAQSEALSLRKQLAIDYGDEDYARKVLGDEGTAQAAAGNVNSVRAQLKKNYDEGLRTLEDQLNKSNLFYSGERIRQNQKASENYQTKLYGATSQEQAALNTIASNLRAALEAADEKDLQAEIDAANRAYQNLPTYPTGWSSGAPDPTGGGDTTDYDANLANFLRATVGSPSGTSYRAPAPKPAAKKRKTVLDPFGVPRQY